MRDPVELALKQAETITALEQRLAMLEQREAMSIRDPVIALPLTIANIQSLVGLRGFWPGGPSGATGTNAFTLADISGHGQHFLDNSEPPADFFSPTNPIPYVRFNGINEWFSIADSAHWDIRGTETSVGGDWRGLTMLAWARFDNTASASEFILSKRQNTTQLSYWLMRTSTGEARFSISNSGADSFGVSSVATMAAGNWHLVGGRFDPSTESAVFLDGVWTSNTTSIPAAIYNSTSDLFMAGRDDATTPGQGLLDGRIALAFICAADIPDLVINRLWNISRHIFGI